MNIKEQLYKPIEDIKNRKGRGGTYDYVSWKDVVDRMNEIFDMNWSSSAEYQEVLGANVILRVKVCATDPKTGTIFCQEGYGGAVLRDSDEPGTAHKSAYSKALKDACKKWGIGLHLDAEDDVPPSFENSTPPNGFSGAATGVTPPTPSVSSQAPTTFAIPSQPVYSPAIPTPPETIIPNAGLGYPPVEPTAPQPTTVATEPAVLTHSETGTQLPSIPKPTTDHGYAIPDLRPRENFKPAQASNAPVPPSMVTPAPPAVNNLTDVIEEDAVTSDTPGTINNVQEMAIKNLSRLKGINTTEEIITTIIKHKDSGITREIKDIKDLSYTEAVTVIKSIKNIQQ